MVQRCASLRQDDRDGINFLILGPGGGGLTITTSSPMSGGTQGVFYSQTLAASGGQTPYSWSLASGSGPLPSGLSLSSSGVISGTPSAAGTFNFTARVTDGASATAQKALSITINASGQPNSQFITQSVPSSLQPGQSFSVNTVWLNTGNETWSSQGGFNLSSQNPPNNTTWGGNTVSLLGFNIPPGQQHNITFTSFAPQTPGTYNFQWQLSKTPSGVFGQPSTNISIQVGSSCAFSINPGSQSFSSSGGTGSVGVTTQSGCSWTATSNASWIQITSGSSGSGSGTVGYLVSSNSSTSS